MKTVSTIFVLLLLVACDNPVEGIDDLVEALNSGDRRAILSQINGTESITDADVDEFLDRLQNEVGEIRLENFPGSFRWSNKPLALLESFNGSWSYTGKSLLQSRPSEQAAVEYVVASKAGPSTLHIKVCFGNKGICGVSISKAILLEHQGHTH